MRILPRVLMKGLSSLARKSGAAKAPRTRRASPKSYDTGQRERSWGVIAAVVGSLLIAILAAGVLGLLLNLSLQRASEEASYAMELEDDSDELSMAILNLRWYHRNLRYRETTPQRVAELESAYTTLLQEIDNFEPIEPIEIRDPNVRKPVELRAMAQTYHGEFRPAIQLADSDPEAYAQAVEQGFEHIDQMEAAAKSTDNYAERHAEYELGMMDRASVRSIVLLVSIVLALLAVGIILSFLALRVVNELRSLYTEQKAAAKAKTDFLADVSHELRTPLTVLKGNAELGLTLDKEWPHRNVLQEILRVSSRMTEMVEDLLFLSRSDSPVTPVEIQPVWVERLIEDLASQASALTRKHEVRLLTELSGKGKIRIDQRRMVQAALILIDNAAKYGQKGSRSEHGTDGTVRLGSRITRGELVIEVEDYGPGIPEDELPKIFERFYRMDKARSRSLGGTGLGLAIVKSIVEVHDGLVEAESRVGTGTVMRIRIPVTALD